MSGAPPRQVVRGGLWQRLDAPGLERFELSRDRSEWLLLGTILTLADRDPVEVRYRVACDASWRTKRVDVTAHDSAGERSLRLAAGDGRWSVNDRRRDELDGCVDVDLAWSPSTNTLPIRRLELPVGGNSGILTTAWVRFPELTVEALPQEYRRLSERRYRYTSRGGAFTAEIAVDDQSLVVEYEGLWRRAADSR